METVKQSEEEFVRGVWERADMCSTITGPYLKNYVALGTHRHTKAHVPEEYARNKSEAWSAAAAFTCERLEQVRQLREEIEEIRKDCESFARRADQPINPEYAIYRSILARLESILADKLTGMKAGGA